MRIFAIGVLALLLGCATSAPSEEHVVAYAKALQVSAIDAALPPGLTLAEWISARAQGGLVTWESNDCGEQTGNPATTPSDFPICAEAQFKTCAGLTASLSVVVGTFRRGIGSRPGLFWAQIGGVDGSVDNSTLSAFGHATPVCRDAPNNSFKPNPLRGFNLPCWLSGGSA
jgi:hypothetical protein